MDAMGNAQKGEQKKKKMLPNDEVSLFCEQAALILKSGVPVVEGFEALFEGEEEQARDDSFRKLLTVMKGRDQLSDALTAAGVFPDYMIRLVKIGEVSGKLEDVMIALAAYYRRESDIGKAIKSAVLYPAVLMLVLAAVIVILVTQVMPIFNRVFQSLGAEMDASMTGVVNVGSTLGTVVMGLIAFAFFCVAVFAVIFKVKGGEFAKDLIGGIIRPFGSLFQTISKARFASSMSLMQTAGLPMEQALELAKDLPFDKRTKAKIDLCAHKITDDNAETPRAMSEAKLFDPIHLKMIKAGYQAGQLDTAMERVAQIYEEKTDTDIYRIVGLIEPTLVVILTIAIGGILLSVMLPLAGIMTSIL
ncbi:MAG: type II secretion system F family protein [Clostridia bacterium]|nr:type II secretion system F family protein [Clostridia bacterium]